jgi:hypothetical protein
MKTLFRLVLAVLIALGAGVAPGPAVAFDPGGVWPGGVWPGGFQKVQDRGKRRPPAAAPLAPSVPRNREAPGQRRARDAVKRGEIRSLDEVTTVVQRRYPGRLLDVRLDDNRGRPIYRLKMLTRDGRVLNVAVDARSAQILGVAGR